MLLLLLSCVLPPPALADVCDDVPAPESPGPDGRELFLRSWVPGDPRASGGDGLGPRFNDASCVACHASGGPGGAGGADHDVRLRITRAGAEVAHATTLDRPISLELLELLSTRSVARATNFADFTPPFVRRNTPALFGVGLLDAVPDEVLLEAAAVADPNFPEITGRVAHAADGRIARFGWKGQIADLDTFVATACANELGLDVPTVAQPGPAPFGYDLDEEELSALTAFVRALPAPGNSGEEAAQGERLFHEIGCESCHRRELGGVNGVYSDLLLHDLGDAGADGAAGYGVRQVVAASDGAATAPEWRTPPLWGVRDSGPYLHDGRAVTLATAIAVHDGEAAPTRKRYLALSAADQWAVQAFLRTLVAPAAAAVQR